MVTLKTTEPENTKPSNNIFKSPITGGKVVVEKREEKTRKTNMKKAYVYFGVTAVFLVAYSVSFLFPQAQAYLGASSEIAALENQVEEYDTVIIPNLEKEKDLHKSAYDEEYQEKEDALDNVFPPDIDKLGIIQRLENFATSIEAKTPPFEFNSISFGEEIEGRNSTILPISTSIYSSTTNFDRFLQLINLSGRLDSDIQIRLMEISNINIKYRGIDSKTGEDKGVDFSVKLNAYSR